MAKLLTGTRIYGTANVDNILYVGGVTPVQAVNVNSGSIQVTGGIGVTGNVVANNILFPSANAQNSSVVAYSSSNIYDLDDLSYAADGYKNTFLLTYNQQPVSIPSPFNLMVTVNGLIQPAFDYKYDTVWLSYMLTASKGYTLDNSGNLRFADSPPADSQILVRTVAGSVPPSNKKIYPFKPLDILMGY